MMDNFVQIAKNHKPRKLVNMARKYGDDSFGASCDTMDEDLSKLLPDVIPSGFQVSHHSAIMLSGLVCVGPHTDPSVGILKTRHSMFGLLSGGKNLKLYVRDNGRWSVFKMSPGDWVVFEDGKEHMVLADTAWSGIAIQVKKVNENLTGDCNE